MIPTLLFSLLLAATGGHQATVQTDQGWELVGGRTTLLLNRHLLDDLGIEAIPTQAAVADGDFLVSTIEHEADFPRLRLAQPGASFAGFAGGALRHRGGLELWWDGNRITIADFDLVPARGARTFEVVTPEGLRPFFLDNPHPQYIPESSEYVFLNMDLRITAALAERLGRPELKGFGIGAAHVRTNLARAQEAALSVGGLCPPDDIGDIDIELTSIGTLTEVFHDTEKVAMAPSAELENVGEADVDWFQSISPDNFGGVSTVGQHPFLTMSLYRLADGIFEQIGQSDLKHAFFAANSNCACPGGQILKVGCRDNYSASTNWNRLHLAPPDELNAFTGDWVSDGSHFDGVPVDDIRHHQGESDHADSFEHRLAAKVEDLSTPGARYFIESWYVVKDDVNIFNSMGYREVEPFFSGSVWTFPFAAGGAFTLGPAVDFWVDPSSPPADAKATVLETGEGRLQVSTRAAAAPNGLVRYDFAVMNLDFDRQIDSFSVPLPAGVTIANPWFGDLDDNAANDWTVTQGPTAILWSLPATETSALDWGTLYNFHFEANADSTDATVDLGVFAAGAPTALTAASKGPSGTFFSVSTLDLTLDGSGGGSVSSNPVGIDCGSDCAEFYATGMLVGLTAAADPGSALIRWTEAGAGGGTLGTDPAIDATLNTDRSLVATFELCDRVISNQMIVGDAVFEACESLSAGPAFEVAATGTGTLRAGSRVTLLDGVTVSGTLIVEIDPVLLP